MPKVTCPDCNGVRDTLAVGIVYSPKFIGEHKPAAILPCHTCGGTGFVSDVKVRLMERGEKFREHRVSTLQLGLREAARQWGMNAIDLSQIEQGEVDTDWTPPGWKEEPKENEKP